MADTFLSWKNVSVTFPSFEGQAKTLPISIPDGEVFENEFLWIDGPSGVGKSTLLHLLKGIIPRYLFAEVQGEFLYKRNDILKLFPDELDKKCVYVFQNPYSQIVTPRAKEEIVFSMENYSFSRDKIKEESKKWTTIFELENLLEQKTSTLSGGQCQRLVLASSLACSPEIILFDEPTAFLDSGGQKDFYELLGKLKGHFTIIVIDHHAPELIHLCDKKINWPFQKEKELKKFSDLDFSSSKNAELNIHSLSFSYAEKSIFKDLDLNFQGSKIISIVGKNGTGKSTFFKMLTGELKPDFGEIDFLVDNEAVPFKKWAELISIVYQNSEAQFFFDTVYAELCFNVQDPAFVLELAKILGLEDTFDRSPYLLSEGQKRRLSILIAIAQGRPLLLHDEPTYGQDAVNIDLLTEMFLKLKKAGRLQLIITHDLSWARKISDEVFILEDQKMVPL